MGFLKRYKWYLEQAWEGGEQVNVFSAVTVKNTEEEICATAFTLSQSVCKETGKR